MDWKLLRVSLVAVFFSLALFLILLWRPERQVRLHQAHFLKAVEERAWARAGRFVAENYSDRWGHDKGFVLREGREAFRQFIVLGVEQEERALHVANGTGTVTARLAITGTGGPLVALIQQRLEELVEPFTFRWQQRSWKPWDWQLVSLNQPELEIPEY